MPYMSYSLKLGDHESLAFFFSWRPSEKVPVGCPACNPDPDSRSCIPESSSCLLITPVQDSLVSALQLLAPHQPSRQAIPGSSERFNIGFYFLYFA